MRLTSHLRFSALILAVCLSLGHAHVFSQAHVRFAAGSSVTDSEYLTLYFRLRLHRHESDHLNSFNLIWFYPGSSADESLLVIFQTYNAAGVSIRDAVFREEIQLVGKSFVDAFESMAESPEVRSRWPLRNPEENLIVKHVRVRDQQEVLAVTHNGVTSFDPTDFRQAEHRVEQLGGVWTF